MDIDHDHGDFHDKVISVGGGGGVSEEATRAAEYPSGNFRNQRFKLVPRIVDGPWVVTNTVPAKPALLGQKLTQRYFRGECYVETCVHVGSSMVANRITGLCRGFSTQIEVDIGVTLEGRSEEELPEKMIGCARMTYTRTWITSIAMASERVPLDGAKWHFWNGDVEREVAWLEAVAASIRTT